MIKLKLNKAITCYKLPTSIKDDICALLRFKNPEYEDNKRMGRFNMDTPKYIRLFTLKNNQIIVPIGFMITLKTLLKKEKYKIYDNRFIFKCDYVFKGVLKDFQKIACTNMLRYKTGTLVAPTGAGKTVMALYLIYKRKQKTVIIVHTKALADQWYERIHSFIGVNDYEIGMIGDGKFRIGRRITIALVQSMYARIDELKNVWGYVIVDECHRVSSRTFSVAINGLNAKFKNGLSATPYRRDKLTKLIFMYCGDIRHKVPKKLLIKNGSIVQPSFTMMPTEYTTKLNLLYEYSTMLSELTNDLDRNKQIVRDIVVRISFGRACILVLSDRKEHCYTLQAMLSEKGIKALCLTGDITSSFERSKITRNIKVNGPVVIATGQLIGEGFDCPVLNTLFSTTPIAFKGRVLQYIGRIMRPDSNGGKPQVYDYVDINVKTLLNQAHGRIKVYGKKNTKWSD